MVLKKLRWAVVTDYQKKQGPGGKQAIATTVFPEQINLTLFNTR